MPAATAAAAAKFHSGVLSVDVWVPVAQGSDRVTVVFAAANAVEVDLLIAKPHDLLIEVH
jgi:hypothetical protein